MTFLILVVDKKRASRPLCDVTEWKWVLCRQRNPVCLKFNDNATPCFLDAKLVCDNNKNNFV